MLVSVRDDDDGIAFDDAVRGGVGFPLGDGDDDGTFEMLLFGSSTFVLLAIYHGHHLLHRRTCV